MSTTLQLVRERQARPGDQPGPAAQATPSRLNRVSGGKGAMVRAKRVFYGEGALWRGVGPA